MRSVAYYSPASANLADALLLRLSLLRPRLGRGRRRSQRGHLASTPKRLASALCFPSLTRQILPFLSHSLSLSPALPPPFTCRESTLVGLLPPDPSEVPTDFMRVRVCIRPRTVAWVLPPPPFPLSSSTSPVCALRSLPPFLPSSPSPSPPLTSAGGGRTEQVKATHRKSREDVESIDTWRRLKIVYYAKK